MAKLTDAERQLEAQAVGYSERVLKVIDGELQRAGAPLCAVQRRVVRRAIMAQNSAFTAAVRLSAAQLFQEEVTRMKGELGEG
jgi:hypothetical protein